MFTKLIPVFLALAICFSIRASFPSTHGVPRVDDAPILITYFVGDFPLWSADGKTFEPRLLIEYAKSKLDSTTPPGTDAPKIKFFEKTKSLIVTGTKENHAQMQKLLEDLREAH
jgi:hypothetical protein